MQNIMEIENYLKNANDQITKAYDQAYDAVIKMRVAKAMTEAEAFRISETVRELEHEIVQTQNVIEQNKNAEFELKSAALAITFNLEKMESAVMMLNAAVPRLDVSMPRLETFVGESEDVTFVGESEGESEDVTERIVAVNFDDVMS